MTRSREIQRWLLSVSGFLFASILTILTAFYFSGKMGHEDLIRNRKARTLLTTIWNEVDERWAEQVRIPKKELDDLIKAKWGDRTFANLTTFEPVILSDPLIIYHDTEAGRSVHVLFRDGAISPWDHTWRRVFTKAHPPEPPS